MSPQETELLFPEASSLAETGLICSQLSDLQWMCLHGRFIQAPMGGHSSSVPQGLGPEFVKLPRTACWGKGKKRNPRTGLLDSFYSNHQICSSEEPLDPASPNRKGPAVRGEGPAAPAPAEGGQDGDWASW